MAVNKYPYQAVVDLVKDILGFDSFTVEELVGLIRSNPTTKKFEMTPELLMDILLHQSDFQYRPLENPIHKAVLVSMNDDPNARGLRSYNQKILPKHVDNRNEEVLPKHVDNRNEEVLPRHEGLTPETIQILKQFEANMGDLYEQLDLFRERAKAALLNRTLRGSTWHWENLEEDENDTLTFSLLTSLPADHAQSENSATTTIEN